MKVNFISAMNAVLPKISEISKAMADAAIKGEGFWASIYAGAQVALTGDDALKNLKERAKLAGQIATAQKVVEINTKSFGAEDRRTIAAKEQLAILRERMNTAMNYFKVLQQGAKAETAAAAGAGAGGTGGGGTRTGAASLWTPRDEEEYRLRVEAMKELGATKQQIDDAAAEREDRRYAARSEAARELKTRQEDMANSAKRLWEETRTPAERFDKQIKHLNDLLRAGAIDFDTYERAGGKAAEQLAAIGESAEKASDTARDLGLTFSSAFEDAIVNGENLRDTVRGLGTDIARIVARKTITEPIASGVSSFISGINWGSFLPKFASGTDYVPQTGPAIVHKGERIIPAGENVAGGYGGVGKGGGDTYIIDARGADSAGLARVEGLILQLHGSIERRALSAVEGAYNRAGRRSGMTL